MATAKSVIDVILGEAKGKSYQDMLHIASVIANRSRDLRESLENVVQNKNEFNAYGKPLPPGVGKYRSLAEKALAEVKTKGPVTPAQFYATPSAVKNLPKGLKKVTSTDGHDYFVDPQKRAIGTAVGYKKPQGIQTAQLTGPASASARGSANLGYTDTYTGVDSLHPAMQARASAFLDDAKRQGLDLVFNEGFRPNERQQALYEKGRTVDGNIITNAPAGKSIHNYGMAFDVVPRSLKSDPQWAPESPLWAKVGDTARKYGLEWGGDWSKFTDKPHVQAAGASWQDLRGLPQENGFPKLPEDVETAMYYLPEKVPIPTPRQPMAMMAQAKAADRTYNPGGIVGAKAISLNPVSSANAGEMPKVTRSPLPAIQERIRPMPIGAQAKTSTGVGYSLPQSRPAPLSDSAFSARYSPVQSQFAATPQRTQRALPNVASSAYSDARPMPTGTIPQRVSAPVQSTPAPRYNPLPSGPVAPSVSPATMAAAYGQYAQTRMAAPSTPMQANPVVTAPRIQATGTAGTMTTPQIAGPLSQAPIQAPTTFPVAPAKPTVKQKIKGTLQNVLAPENLKSMGGQLAGGAAGSLLGGPIGGILGGLIGKQIMSQPQGQGLLAGLFGGGNNGYQGQSTYIGNGVNAVDRAMYGNRAGDTATYNSQGGGSVTNLGNGTSQRTSSRYGWTETTHRDGSKSISYKK